MKLNEKTLSQLLNTFKLSIGQFDIQLNKNQNLFIELSSKIISFQEGQFDI